MFSRPSVWSNRIGLVLLSSCLTVFMAGCPEKPAIDQSHSVKSGDPATAPATTNPSSGVTVASVRGLPVSQAELNSMLYDAFGLRLLFDLAELNLAKEMLAKANMELTQADIDAERDMLLVKLCGPDRNSWDNLFNQFLRQKNLSRAEFEIKIVQTRACLRKVITPQVVDRIPEPLIRKGFDQMFGAQRRIQDIELPNLDAVARARQRLTEVSFGEVAKEMSLDSRTRDNGGRWEPFAHNYEPVPEVIRVAAFGLEVGSISEPLQVESHYHLIKVIEAIDPKVYKYDEENRKTVKETLEQRMIETGMTQDQDLLGKMVQKEIEITDPILARKWADLLPGNKPTTLDRDDVSDRIGRSRPTTVPTTAPTTMPIMGPFMMPTTAPTTAPTKVDAATTGPSK